MARFYGTVGFLITEENPLRPGVWAQSKIIERNYYGDITRSYHRWERNEHTNDDVRLNNTISIICDSYAFENTGAIRYVKRGGTKWAVTEIEEQRPRLILTLGGVWNG